jgi:hypothetical protein
VDHIDSDVTDLTEPIGALVQTHEFGDGGCSGSTEFPGRDVTGKRRGGWVVFQEWAEKMDVQEMEKHAAEC